MVERLVLDPADPASLERQVVHQALVREDEADDGFCAVSASIETPVPRVANAVLRGDVDVVVTVTVTVTNLARRPVKLLRWQLPTEEHEGALFRIERDGEKVAYTGAYDLSRNGRFTIEYLSRGAHGQDKVALQSEKLYLWLRCVPG